MSVQMLIMCASLQFVGYQFFQYIIYINDKLITWINKSHLNLLRFSINPHLTLLLILFVHKPKAQHFFPKVWRPKHPWMKKQQHLIQKKTSRCCARTPTWINTDFSIHSWQYNKNQHDWWTQQHNFKLTTTKKIPLQTQGFYFFLSFIRHQMFSFAYSHQKTPYIHILYSTYCNTVLAFY